MHFRLFLVLIFAAFFTPNESISQSNIPCDSLIAGTTCENAPIICDIDCLDGFSATMPDFLEDTIRNLLCPASGGNPSNMSWFGFVAGSTTITLDIILDQCVNNEFPQLGVQAGIYSTCQIDNDGNVDPEDVLFCYHPSSPSIDDFTVTSDQFIVGEVYYFFIDGFQGTICDYQVNVITGGQPFELDDPTELVHNGNVPSDTICLGYQNYTLSSDLDTLNIDYYWKINPATNGMPDSFLLMSYTTSWDFEEEGVYTIEYYATNGCDETDTISHSIIVLPEPDEVFDTVGVCFNKFPYAGPQNIDPNGDGFVGWAGPQITYPGGDARFTVTRPNGCMFDQVIHVDEIPPKPRVKVQEVSCGSLDYYGNIYTETTLGEMLSIPDIGEGGCDSMVNLDVYIIDLDAEINVRKCDSTGLLIGVDISNIDAPSGYDIFVNWFDSMGELIDNDDVEDDILITNREDYSAQVGVIINSDTCYFDLDQKTIDPDDNRPAITAIDWSLNICDRDNIGSYEITADQPIKTINWTIPPGTSFVVGNENSQYIELDYTNSSGGILLVEVENFCNGTSPPLSFPIEIIETPDASFDLGQQSCIDSTIQLISTVNFDPNFQYVWNIPSNALLLSGSLNSPGPVEIIFSNQAGSYPIELIAANQNCADTFTQNIEILPEIEDLNIDCSPMANSILFTWEPEPCAASYSIFQNGLLIDEVFSTSYLVENIATNTTVDIQIGINSNCLCAGPRTAVSCTTLDCSGVSVDLFSPLNNICESNWPDTLPLSYNITGGNNTGSLTWSGNYISTAGVFDLVSSGAGIHPVYLEYTEDGCSYEDSISLYLNEDPVLTLEIVDPQCIDDLLGTVNIIATGGDGNFEIFVDEESTADSFNELEVGIHDIEVTDGNLCKASQTITINPPPTITYTLEGKSPIFESERMRVNLTFTMSETSVVDSVVWFVNGEKYCNGNSCLQVDLANLSDGEYEHTLFIYYNDCVIEEIYVINVKEDANVFVPTGFSPNNDGINDFWKIETNDPDLVVNNLIIYDRWGNKVFNKSDFNPFGQNELWDGTFNGKTLRPGVYVMVLDFIDQFGVKKVMSRDITILY
jgi:gliding motility-associated-like protein